MIGDRLDTDITPANIIGLQTMRVRRGPAFWQIPRTVDERPDITVPSLLRAAASLGLP